MLWQLGMEILLRWVELLLPDLLKDGVELAMGDHSRVVVEMESTSFQGPVVPKPISQNAIPGIT